MQAFAITRPLLFSSGSPPPLISPRCAPRPAVRTPVVPRATLSPFASATSDMSSSAQAEMPSLGRADEERIGAVRAQMEFWFSASNLRRDWYLRRQMDEAGWLDPSVFLLFNRIKNLKATLGDIILACQSSDALEVSAPDSASFGDAAGQTRVRRSPSLPDFRENDTDEFARSFIITGLTGDASVDRLMEIFEPMAKVSYVRIYRHKDFPDSPRALLCFQDKATAETVYDQFMENKPEGAEGMSLVWRDQVKRAKRQDSGDADRRQVTMEARSDLIVCQILGLSPDLNWRTLNKCVEAAFDGDRERVGIRYIMFNTGEPDCYVTINSSDSTTARLEELQECGVKVGSSYADIRVLEDGEELAEYWRKASEHQAHRRARRLGIEKNVTNPRSDDLMERNPRGVIVRIDGLTPDANWREVKSDLGRLGKLVYLNYEKSASTCFARFSSPDEASMVVVHLTETEPAEICGSAVHAVILTGDEEEEYWLRAEQTQRDRGGSRGAFTRDSRSY